MCTVAKSLMLFELDLIVHWRIPPALAVFAGEHEELETINGRSPGASTARHAEGALKKSNVIGQGAPRRRISLSAQAFANDASVTMFTQLAKLRLAEPLFIRMSE